jgi:hypothetical protein
MVTSGPLVKEGLRLPTPQGRRLRAIRLRSSGYFPLRLFCLLNDFRSYIFSAVSGLVFAKEVARYTSSKQFINSLTHFLLRENYFPLTLTLSPIGGEGKNWDRFNALWLLDPATSVIPSPPALRGKGWSERGRQPFCQPMRRRLPEDKSPGPDGGNA